MSPIIEIKELTKRFNKRIAVNNINFNIEGGEIFGLVGPNGAGKTTTMRMLVTLLKPDHGEIFVGGHSIRKNPNDVRRHDRLHAQLVRRLWRHDRAGIS